jgi:hypothetical protein
MGPYYGHYNTMVTMQFAPYLAVHIWYRKKFKFYCNQLQIQSMTHRSIMQSVTQHRVLPPGIVFLFPCTRELISPPRFEVHMHARTGKSGFACLYFGALAHHTPGSCASAANSLVRVPLHRCSCADEVHRGACGMRQRKFDVRRFI